MPKKTVKKPHVKKETPAKATTKKVKAKSPAQKKMEAAKSKSPKKAAPKKHEHDWDDPIELMSVGDVAWYQRTCRNCGQAQVAMRGITRKASSEWMDVGNKPQKPSSKKEPWTSSVADYQRKLLKSRGVVDIPETDFGVGLMMADMTAKNSFLGPDDGWLSQLVLSSVKNGMLAQMAFRDILYIMKNKDNWEQKLSLRETIKIFWKAVDEGVLMDLTLNDIGTILHSTIDIFPSNYYKEPLVKRMVKSTSTRVNKTKNRAVNRTARFTNALRTVITLGAEQKTEPPKKICDCGGHECGVKYDDLSTFEDISND